jgi:hypothetical protein
VSAPEPRKPSMLPAAFALMLIGALGVFVWLRRSGEHRDVPATEASTPAAAAAPTSQPAPTPPAAHAPSPSPSPSGGAVAPTGPDGEPQMSSQEPPEPKAKKAKLTLDEKLQLAQQHVGVMQTRADVLQREIDGLDGAGKKEEAAQKRVMLTRLKAHMDRLRAAVAEHREPE